MGYTSSQENTGKTYQDKFMSDKQFQLKNMRKILKKINCEKKKFTPKPLRKRIPVKYLVHGKGEWIVLNLNLKAIKTSNNLNFLVHMLSIWLC